MDRLTNACLDADEDGESPFRGRDGDSGLHASGPSSQARDVRRGRRRLVRLRHDDTSGNGHATRAVTDDALVVTARLDGTKA